MDVTDWSSGGTFGNERHTSSVKDENASLALLILWVGVQLGVAVGWIVFGFARAADFGLADAGTARAEAPDWVVPWLCWTPVVGVVFWFLQYVGPKRSRRVLQLISWVGFAAAATAWVIALIVSSSHES